MQTQVREIITPLRNVSECLQLLGSYSKGIFTKSCNQKFLFLLNRKDKS